MAREQMVLMGIFDSARDAGRAIASLKSLGVTTDEISILAHPDAIPHHKRRIVEPPNGTAVSTAGLAATLVGIGLCAIPLAGLLTAAPLVLAGGVASVSGVNRPIDDLRELGIPLDDVKIALESVRRGGIAIVARVERRYAGTVADALARAGAIDFHKRAEQWEASGWTFEPNAPPYPLSPTAWQPRQAARASLSSP